jgi:putative ABC transport system permease protein
MNLQVRIALRTLAKNKTYVVINVVGVGVALACCIVAYLNYAEWVDFDRIHEDVENVYRVNSTRVVEDQTQLWGVTPLALGPAAAASLPGIERFSRINYGGASVRHEGTMLGEEILYVDPEFFEMLSFPLKSGSVEAISDPGQVILTERTAARYFGTTDPVGESIDFLFISQGEERSLIVGAVLYDVPANSSIQFGIAMNFSVQLQLNGWDDADWTPWQQPVSLFQLGDAVSVESVEMGLQAFVAQQNEARPNWAVSSFFLQPMAEIGHNSNEFEETGLEGPPPFTSILMLMGLAGLILLIACSNFTNTTISLSGTRLREIGLRKAVGARRGELVRQFLSESLLLCIPALLVGILVAYFLARGLYEQGISVAPTFSTLGDLRTWTFLVTVIVITAVVAGSYPAIYITSFRPVQIFAGRSRFRGTNLFTRFLLGSQLTASILAIIIGVVFTQNARYQEALPRGFNADEIIVVPMFNAQVMDVFGPVAQAGTGVKRVSSSGGQVGIFAYQALFRKSAEGSTEHEVHILDLGPNYIETLQLELISGRSFDGARASDLEAAIINETLVDKLGWDVSQAPGQTVVSDGQEYKVIGVVRDFKQFGMRQPVPPMSLHLVIPPRRLALAVQADEADLESVQAYLESEWYKLFPNMPFYSGFLGEFVAGSDRRTNDRMAMSFLFLAVIATAISAFGLFALVSLRIAARTKEIGVRKVLGASTRSLLGLINREVMYVLVASMAAGSAMGYYLCRILLDEMFEFRIGLGPLAGLIAGTTLVFVTAITIGYQVYSAASADPVKAIRVE